MCHTPQFDSFLKAYLLEIVKRFFGVCKYALRELTPLTIVEQINLIGEV